jgi:spore coat polysaccharide biosynthesis predicted glycosyltransferase SpsG
MGERTLLIRVDGGRNVGLGHLMRCLNLCRALEDQGVDALLLARERPELRTVLATETRTVLALPPHADEHTASAFARDIRQTLGGDLILIDLPQDLSESEVDHYAATGLPLVVFDDHGRAASRASAVINALAHPDHLLAQPAVECRYDGAEYIILDPGYRDSQPAEIGEEVHKLLVAMGGSDPHGITARALRALLPLPREIELHVLLGPAYEGGEELRAEVEKSGREVAFHEAVESMPEFLSQFGLGLMSFGVTAYGAARLGLPALLIGHDDSGAAAADAFARLYGCAVVLGRHDLVEAPRLLAETEALVSAPRRRKEMSKRGRAAVDGRGLERVTNIILDLLR